jgi:hypothetical protein
MKNLKSENNALCLLSLKEAINALRSKSVIYEYPKISPRTQTKREEIMGKEKVIYSL